MKQKVVAQRYAGALFDLAKESRQEAKFGSALDDIVEMTKSHPDFLRILQHPVIKREDKKQLLHKLFSSRLPEELFHFLLLLVDKKREDYLCEIAAEFTRLLNLHNQTIITQVVTAAPMTPKTQSLLQKQLEGYLDQQVVMNCDTDPSLLGGVTIKIGDRLIDGSVRTRLSELAQTLVAKS